MAMHNPPHPGAFIREVYRVPNGIGCRELALKLGGCRFDAESYPQRVQRPDPGDGVAPLQGAWAFPGKLADHAGQLRFVAGSANAGLGKSRQDQSQGRLIRQAAHLNERGDD